MHSSQMDFPSLKRGITDTSSPPLSSLRAGLRERLQLLVHRVHEALLVPVLFVQYGEHVPVLGLFEFVEEQESILGFHAHILGPRVAVVGEVRGPVPRDEQVQNLPEVGKAGEQNSLLEK